MIPQRSRVSLALISSLALFFSCGPLFAAQTFSHTVTEDARNLGDIAVYLYGDGSMYTKIAQWNKITPPYVVHLGQKLSLLEKPKLTADEGSAKLLEIWRARFNIFIDDQTISTEEKKVRENFVEELRTAEKVEQKEGAAQQPTAKDELSQGQRLFDAQAYQSAVQHFKKARTMDPNLLTPWFYEIVALRLLKRDDEAKETAVLLISLKPEFKDIPMFKKMFP